jgi:hypothetical protein
MVLERRVLPDFGVEGRIVRARDEISNRADQPGLDPYQE